MPKKRSFNFKTLQGTSSSASKQSGGSNDSDKKSATVNERLGELRKLPEKDAAQKKRELAEAVSHQHRSVPPELRPILGVSESAPPKPKRGIRMRLPDRTPGPAAPKSWNKRPAWMPTSALRGGRKRVLKGRLADNGRTRPHQLLRFSRMTGLDPDAHKSPSSLFHLSLKTAAEEWALFDDEDLPALSELPLRIRLRLLSYLGFYGPPIGVSALEALTHGIEPVDQLDLAGLIGHGGLTLHRLVKLLKQQASKVVETAEVEEVAESWDQDDSFEAALTRQPSTSRFSQLTHLCLSHPPAGPAWQDLLSLSKQLPSITHLSLAYWPRPTLTPNLATTTVSSQHSPDVSAGGSHYYSAIDNDLSEPASILRQLSGSSLRLQWLDLEGCTEWVQALSYEHTEDNRLLQDAIDAPSWSTTPPVTTIFAHNWKNLQYLNFAQGWLPTVPAVQGLPKQTMPFRQRAVADAYLKHGDICLLSEAAGEDMYEVEKRRAEIWLQIEDKAVEAARRIAQTRRAHACRHIFIDHGWERRAV
ncbi:Hypothetical predicted protein [Lecanosticta acicola]|uniref:Uncharacterized protein n=1 Tax=Lecanosticta acicola TaxID=111012 RepID=A0AAI9EDL2_9PEZI|nr:Hypothetical predicted protein [Lecanosticta acicola]